MSNVYPLCKLSCNDFNLGCIESSNWNYDSVVDLRWLEITCVFCLKMRVYYAGITLKITLARVPVSNYLKWVTWILPILVGLFWFLKELELIGLLMDMLIYWTTTQNKCGETISYHLSCIFNTGLSDSIWFGCMPAPQELLVNQIYIIKKCNKRSLPP